MVVGYLWGKNDFRANYRFPALPSGHWLWNGWQMAVPGLSLRFFLKRWKHLFPRQRWPDAGKPVHRKNGKAWHSCKGLNEIFCFRRWSLHVWRYRCLWFLWMSSRSIMFPGPTADACILRQGRESQRNDQRYTCHGSYLWCWSYLCIGKRKWGGNRTPKEPLSHLIPIP